MHLILLLNFNTKLAVYPADEIELITLSLCLQREPARGLGRASGSAAVGRRHGSGSCSSEQVSESLGASPSACQESGLLLFDTLLPTESKFRC